MLREKQKIIHLLSELLQYVLQGEPQKVAITVEGVDENVEVTVEDCGVQRSEEECRQAARFLNAPRRNEMKDYYGGLAGEETFEPGSLRIVRMMVDGGRVEKGDFGTRLTVWWKQESESE